MNKNAAIAIAVSASAVVIALLNSKKNSDYAEYFAETFPELDIKLLEKAHSVLMREAFLGKLDMTDWSKERYERALVSEYNLLNK